MNNEHFHPSDDVLIGFALDELDAPLREEVDTHLDECDACRRDCAATTDTFALLALAAPPVAPPAELRARILEAPRHLPRPNRRPALASFWQAWLRPRRLVPVMLATAAVAVALMLPGLTASDTRMVAFSNGAGFLQVEGPAAHLTTWTLGSAPSGRAYEVWVMRPGAAPRAVGLMADGTPLTIDDVRAGDQIGVTVEPAAGSPRPTTPPVALAIIS